MEVSITSQDLNDWNGNVLVIGVLEERVNQEIMFLDKLINSELLKKKLEDKSFTGKSGQKVHFQFNNTSPEKIVLVGLGRPEELSLDSIREATCVGVKQSLGYSGILGISFPWDAFIPSSAAKTVGEACHLVTFKDNRFKSDPEKKVFPEKIELINLNKDTKLAINELNSICKGVELARYLVGAPPNILTPSQLAEEAINISKEFNIRVKILDKDQCKKKSMGAFLAVAKGSDLEPKFIHLTYSPKGEIKKRVVLIGKGLTFDSGGYNLKVGASQIEKMKYDMGGSAAVIGAARSIAQLKPSFIEVHFLVAACENMVNGSAMHPGDIITASNGKTIEVNNTDAEGRLTLADALVYGCELEPDAIIDLATLTGACVIALGDEIAGLWTENQELSEQITTAAANTGEGIWRMPMQNSYKEGLKSLFADIQNTGPRAGGSITAALFLKEFVNPSIPWAHIDIAGTCWTEKNRGINPPGATGYGVRTLVEWIYNLSKSFEDLDNQ